MLGFLKEFMSHRTQVGAVAPSSRRLARAMTSGIDASTDRVLEVGAGTGAFTRAILGRLEPGAALDIVEMSPRFCRILRAQVVGPWAESNAGRTVRIIESPLEQADLADSYDVIICGLPFNNFPPATARALFGQMLDRLEPGGTMAFFEYAGMRPVKRFLPGAATAAEHGRYIRRIEADIGWRRQLVLGNIPPAWAVHLRTEA